MKKKQLTRVYLPYYATEDSYSNMWGSVDNKELYLKKAIKFTGNNELYGKWMLKVLDHWPASCVHNLSSRAINRQAWIGHAACALAFECPEDITRKAWSFLTEQQQTKANGVADIAILEWENRYTGGAWQRTIWG